MKTLRWLLPFTFGVDMRAIDYALRLAASTGATLVPVSLVSTLPKGARLEHVQQSKDFLEAVQHQATSYQVAIERYEVFTVDVLQSLATLVHDLHCDGIMLVTRGEHNRLMQDEEVKHLLIKPPTALVLIRLPATSSRRLVASHLKTRFFSWLRGHREQPDVARQASDADTPDYVSQGMIQNFSSYTMVHTLNGQTQTIAQGPVASMEAIKDLGTNGGGFFNTNAAHPFENPNSFTALLIILSEITLGAGLFYMFGKMVGNTRQGWVLWIVSAIIFVIGLAIVIPAEQTGNPL